MKAWRQFLDSSERWEFLYKLASATTGLEVEVYPGFVPRAVQRFPRKHLSRVEVPPAWLDEGREGLLRAGLSHELLHVMYSGAEALSGILFAIWLIANSLEDSRLEVQNRESWPGLVRPVQELSRHLTQFLTRQRKVARDAKSAKLFEIGIALYMLLTGFERDEVNGAVDEMSAAVASELLPIAQEALSAKDTAGVVEIAKRIVEELERAAEKAAEKINTPTARSYVHGLRREIRRAMQETVEEVLLRLYTPPRPSGWYGPWYRGSGGYPFHPSVWEWELAEDHELGVPDRAVLLRWLTEADPLRTLEALHERQPVGRLGRRSRDLVRAATGSSRRVFTRTFEEQRLVLPHLLEGAQFVLLIEAHKQYNDRTWALLLNTVTALSRLLGTCRAQFVVRAFTATRPEVEVEDPRTKRRYRRPANEFYLHVGTVKPPDEPWSSEHEVRLGSLPKEGFNQPLEGYSKALSWNIRLPEPNDRKRIVLTFGDACWLNVGAGHLQYATGPLRQADRQQAIYVHLGRSIEFYEQHGQELSEQFDAWVQGQSLRQTVMRTLLAVLYQLADAGSPTP